MLLEDPRDIIIVASAFQPGEAAPFILTVETDNCDFDLTRLPDEGEGTICSEIEGKFTPSCGGQADPMSNPIYTLQISEETELTIHLQYVGILTGGDGIDSVLPYEKESDSGDYPRMVLALTDARLQNRLAESMVSNAPCGVYIRSITLGPGEYRVVALPSHKPLLSYLFRLTVYSFAPLRVFTFGS